MVTSIDALVHRAVEPGQAIGQHRCPGVHRDVANLVEFVGGFGGEDVGKRDLPFVQQVDGKAVGLQEHRIARCTLANAHQQQRRIKRNGGERIGRHAPWAALLVTGCDHGYPGDERTEGTAQGHWVYRLVFVFNGLHVTHLKNAVALIEVNYRDGDRQGSS
ncbi:hypothetical protein D3C78_1295660 [compost metagenome]